MFLSLCPSKSSSSVVVVDVVVDVVVVVVVVVDVVVDVDVAHVESDVSAVFMEGLK